MQSDKNKYLVIIRGLSGSGKTTFADLICADAESRASISADDYFYDDDDIFKFEPSEIKKSHAWCIQEADTCMAQGFEVVVIHNVIGLHWQLDPYMQLASKRGYQIIVTSLYDSGLNDAALAARSEHNVPIHVIRSQRKSWEFDVFKTQN